MPELKPCPFCGGEPTHDTTQDEDLWSHNTVPYRRVRCDQCEIGTDWVCDGYEPTEVEAWNRRPEGARAAAPVALEDRSSVSSGVLDDCEAFEKAMVEADYHRPDRSHNPGRYRYRRDQDRYLGWKLARAAAPVVPAGYALVHESKLIDWDTALVGLTEEDGGERVVREIRTMLAATPEPKQ